MRWGATVLPPVSGYGWLLLRTAPDGTPLDAVESQDTQGLWSRFSMAWDAEGLVMVREDAPGTWTLEARDWNARLEWSQPLELPGQPSLGVKEVRALQVHPKAGVRVLVELGSGTSTDAPSRVLLATPRR